MPTQKGVVQRVADKPAEDFTRFAWLLGQERFWKLNAADRRIEYTGDLGSWLSRAYEPLREADLHLDFIAIGAISTLHKQPAKHPAVQRVALKFVREYGPLDSVFNVDETPPLFVPLDTIIREARKRYETWTTAERMEHEPPLAALVRAEVDEHIAGVHRVLRLVGDGLRFGETVDNLLAAIWLQFARTIDSGGELRRCKNPRCRRPFAARRNDQDFHDSKCRNRAHVARVTDEKKRIAAQQAKGETK